ncbi:class II aldolase/adducin family protein [Limimaricola pyoseonensis]|uniref:Rhamnose utilisation protein RhaD, predicted bifunctional aldolase and dehydrogenase n=1 Tax=Limimaricola pyoseonensis TaxID=521013 RepID=A0A1G7IL31_9RHOB|nr:class II aldolase/adducin family protein [Limimaricola pyoseonensis]SDF13254.1 Rhamnose utilisation protein RhaD, predicted bifunctional aldolase and dehydrogenase [Limimaricola pyoseonensis]
MQSRWNDDDAARFAREAEAQGQSAALGLRVYSSRLIGGDPDLVLHGGGNTSVKIGSGADAVIHIKGSGWDLGAIEAPGLPAVRLETLLAARGVARMSDDRMVAMLRGALLEPKAPTPSVEALLHAYAPHAFVDHGHATAVLALADQPGMEPTVADLFGGEVAFVPYVMPGFALSQACDRVMRDNPGCKGLWLEQHGLFTFGATARESYERMIDYTGRAEAHLADRGIALPGPEADDAPADPALAGMLARALSGGALGDDPALDWRSTPSIRALVSRDDLSEIVHRGTATPDHVIRLKPFPMIVAPDISEAGIAAALDAYGARYRAYFERHAPHAEEEKIMLDPLPRAVLVEGQGLFGLGRDGKAARIAGDLWEQTARIVLAAEAYGRFTPIAERDLFDMEYWSLEQAKLR